MLLEKYKSLDTTTMISSVNISFLLVSIINSLLLLSQRTSAFIIVRSDNTKLISVGSQQQQQQRSFLYATSVDTSFMWNRGLNFGKGQFKFYDGFDKWMSVFPDEDRLANPELFNLPLGVYEVRLEKPLGIIFEEIELNKGLYVKELVEDGNADIDGTILPGDILVGITAVKVVGAKYERRLIPCRNFDFDTMVGAITSNEPRFGCSDVYLLFEQPGIANPKQVDTFLQFFEPPFDNPWKQQQ